MLDAYTIRKAVPRILIAAIGINLSIYLCVAVIDIVNVIGHGLATLLVTPFDNPDSAFHRIALANSATSHTIGVMGILGLLGAAVGVAAAPGAAALLAVGAIYSFLPAIAGFVITVALIMLAVVFTLVLRQGIIIFSVIVAPVAIALFVLPGTEKYFKKWWDLFSTALMVYPIVAALFAVSTVLTTILLGTANVDSEAGLVGASKLLAGVVVAFAPLVMIPFAFKLAGGAISAVMNAGVGGSKTLSRSARAGLEKMKQNPNSLYGKAVQENRFARTKAGLTGRQIWAGRPGGGDLRRERMQSALSLDERLDSAALSETDRYKYKAQDSDVLDSQLMTAEQVAASRADHRAKILAAKDVLGNSSSTLQERTKATDTIAESQRILNAHADADQMGRNGAAARAAFLSPDRIKFTKNTYDEERATARRIFGDQGAAEAMNAYQAIAKGQAGRADLAGNLYGKEYDPNHGISSQSMYTLMNQGRPAAIKSFIDNALDSLNTPIDPKLTGDDLVKAKEERRRKAAQLHAIKSGKSGGTEGNIVAANERRGDIDRALDSFATEEAREIITSKDSRMIDQKPTGREITTVKGGQTITEREMAPLTPDEELDYAKRLANADLAEISLGYSQIDPSLRDK